MELDSRRLAAIDAIFDEVLDADPGERGALLDAACGGDADLRREVEGLLRDAEAGPGPFDRGLGSLLPGSALARPRAGPAPEVSFTGERLAHYRILSLVAEGGMGEVYLAEDDRMPRKVALKLLPLRFTRDAGRLQRFQLEARSASALNHPGIVTIYEVGEAEGVHFIASELIEGETLRQVLGRGPLPVAEATDIALQVAAALGVAHAAGIVHRDIKPENVMRRADGFVKVVDFGLVKLVDEDAASASVTGVGAVLGTARYMSPEQARGEEVDSRTDLFALGVVLYEMLSGRAPFRGETFAHAFRAVLNDAPVPLGEVCPSAPAELSRIVMKLLSKEREARYQTADELRAALRRFRRSLPQEASAAYAPVAPEPGAPEPLPPVPKHAARVAGASVLVALLAVAGWSATRGSRPTKSSPGWQDAVVTKLTDRLGAEVFPSLSPDGRLVVFEARNAGDSDLHVQAVGETTSRSLTSGPAEDTQPAFSPDGSRIAFRRNEKDAGGLFVVSRTGGAVRRLTTFGFNPAWSPDGQRIVCTGNSVDGWNRSVYPSRMWIVDVATGSSSELDVPDAVQPSVSPDGRRVAYWGVHKGYRRDIFTVPLSGGEPVPVTDDAAVDVAPVWSPDGDFLYFVSNRNGTFALWRVAMDEDSGRPTGRPELVPTPASRVHRVAFSGNGRRLAVGSLSTTQNIEELSFDPARGEVVGEPRAVTLTSDEVTNPAISPDGTLLAYQRSGAQPAIHVLRLGEPEARLITPEGVSEQSPRFSPDGARIAFFSNRGGVYQAYTARPDGSGAEPVTDVPAPGAVLPFFSPDGSRLAYSLLGGKAFVKTLATGELLETPSEPGLFHHFVAQSWSPDGRYLSGSGYLRTSRESLRSTGLYLFDLSTQRYEKLSDFGLTTRWLSDGCRILFLHRDRIYLADTRSKEARVIHTASPRALRNLDLSRDDRTIYVSVATTEADLWLLTRE